jgi:hypothetical protein
MTGELKDSGKREDFSSGCVRDASENKPRPDLISPYFSMRIGDHLDAGARKYAERNWEKGMPISRCIASLERHLMQYKMGLTDEDHVAAIGCNIMFIAHYEEMIKRGLLPNELNDLPRYEQQIPHVKELAGAPIDQAYVDAIQGIETGKYNCFAGHLDVICNCMRCTVYRKHS